MSIAPAEIARLRASISISTVARRRLDLWRDGGEWIGLCPFHAERTGSFKISDRKGFYHCFGCGAHGDVIDLVAHLDGLGFREAVRTIRQETGIVRPESRPRARVRRDDDGQRKTQMARRIWAEARPIMGTVSERYLRSRGLAQVMWQSLRHADSLIYTDGQTTRRLPGMVALVTDSDGGFMGIQRTWLTAEGGKAAVRDPRRSLGRVFGGAVRFGVPTSAILVAEGIETVLSILSAYPAIPAAATLSSGSMAVFAPPEAVSRVVIAQDMDAAGDAAALRLAARMRETGRRVSIVRPSRGDFNDDLMVLGAAGLAAHLRGDEA